VNGYEASARALKVDRLLAKVPCPKTLAEVELIARWLEAFAPADRARFAEAAGVRSKPPPSDTTWAAVIAGARARRPADESRRSA
jgi:hypothetical protein